jgi:rubrerythrin
VSESLRDRARALLAEVVSRGDVKRVGARLDDERPLRDAVIADAIAQGREAPEGLGEWAGKRVVRWALAREERAQERTTPIARDEDFRCEHCGLDVPAHGRTARDHCPACLRSLHVDVVPGDRAATCRGLLDPTGIEGSVQAPKIVYRCRRCGTKKVNRAILDGDVPDSWEAIVRLSSERGGL